MSTEMLRRAAALMRERATVAPVPAGPWETEFSDVIRTDVSFGSPGYLIVECATLPEAQHIASWHPAVALAVATWLDSHADIHALRTCDERLIVPCPAIVVARAYLGDD